MKILNKIVSFLKRNPRIIEYAIIFIIVWFVAVIPVKNRLKQEKAEREKFENTLLNNIDAIKDSIKRSVDENGRITSEKLGYAVQKVEDLQKYDEQLYNKIIQQSGDIKNLQSYIDSELDIILTEIGKSKSELDKVSDSTYNLTYNYDYSDEGLTHEFEVKTPLFISKIDSSFAINKGESKILTNTFNVKLEYRTVKDEETGKTKVLASSPSSLVYFNHLNSVYIDDKINSTDKKNSRLGIGVSLGAAYINNSVTPYIGVGLNYNIFTFKSFK